MTTAHSQWLGAAQGMCGFGSEPEVDPKMLPGDLIGCTPAAQGVLS